MNEFTAKKLAEVQAFVDTGRAIWERSNSFGSTAPQAVTILQAAAKVNLASSIPEDKQELFNTKVQKTTQKLTAMMELYIGDEWDNPVEVLEWSSFFAGAGAAHAGLTKSATETSAPELSKSLGSLEQAYRDLLDQVITQLQAAAQTKSKS